MEFVIATVNEKIDDADGLEVVRSPDHEHAADEHGRRRRVVGLAAVERLSDDEHREIGHEFREAQRFAARDRRETNENLRTFCAKVRGGRLERLGDVLKGDAFGPRSLVLGRAHAGDADLDAGDLANGRLRCADAFEVRGHDFGPRALGERREERSAPRPVVEPRRPRREADVGE